MSCQVLATGVSRYYLTRLVLVAVAWLSHDFCAAFKTRVHLTALIISVAASSASNLCFEV